jgi:hypothetical protein
VTSPTRIQRRRTRGWRLDRAADPIRGGVIVSRPSRYGNPFTIAAAMEVLGLTEAEARTAAITEFRLWLAGSRSNWQSDEADKKRERILAGLHELRGKDLACTCEPGEPCHADELLLRANMPAAEQAAWIAVVRARVDRQRLRDGEQPLHPTANTTTA